MYLKRMCTHHGPSVFQSYQLGWYVLQNLCILTTFLPARSVGCWEKWTEVCHLIVDLSSESLFFIQLIVALFTLEPNYWVHIGLELLKLLVNCHLCPCDTTLITHSNAPCLQAYVLSDKNIVFQLSFDSHSIFFSILLLQTFWVFILK